MKRKVKPQLNDEDAINLQATVESEGFDYAFRYYSHFPEIKDKKFQSLRKAYVKAAQELSDYCRLEEELEPELCEYCDAPLSDGCFCAEEMEEEHEAAKYTCDECGGDLDGNMCPTCDAD
jgi:RNase P subunit RPR2